MIISVIGAAAELSQLLIVSNMDAHDFDITESVRRELHEVVRGDEGLPNAEGTGAVVFRSGTRFAQWMPGSVAYGSFDRYYSQRESLSRNGRLIDVIDIYERDQVDIDRDDDRYQWWPLLGERPTARLYGVTLTGIYGDHALCLMVSKSPALGRTLVGDLLRRVGPSAEVARLVAQSSGA